MPLMCSVMPRRPAACAAAEHLHAGGVDAVDRLREQAHVAHVRMRRDVFDDVALHRGGGGEVQLRIHAQCIQVRRQRRQLPQVPVAQAAVGIAAPTSMMRGCRRWYRK
jgi:hypothetical protein